MGWGRAVALGAKAVVWGGRCSITQTHNVRVRAAVAPMPEQLKELADAIAASLQKAGDFEVFVAGLRATDWFTATVQPTTHNKVRKIAFDGFCLEHTCPRVPDSYMIAVCACTDCSDVVSKHCFNTCDPSRTLLTSHVRF